MARKPIFNFVPAIVLAGGAGWYAGEGLDCNSAETVLCERRFYTSEAAGGQ